MFGRQAQPPGLREDALEERARPPLASLQSCLEVEQPAPWAPLQLRRRLNAPSEKSSAFETKLTLVAAKEGAGPAKTEEGGEGKKQESYTPAGGGGRSASRPGRAVSSARGICLGSGAGRMLVRKGARAGPGLPRGWTALCLLSLLSSGLVHSNSTAGPATAPSIPGTTFMLPTNASNLEATTPSPPASPSPSLVSQDSNVTSEAPSSSSGNITSTSAVTTVSGIVNSSMETQTSPTSTVFTTPTNATISETTVKPSLLPGNVSSAPSNSTSLETSHTPFYTESPSTVVTIKGEIRCSEIKQVKLNQGICLERNDTSKCEDFKKDKGEDLIQILCEKEQAKDEARECSVLLAQSEIKPQCLMLILANRSELLSKLQLMKKYQSGLEKLGIHRFTEESVGNHQSYSRKTLIALVTTGILLAILGTTGYFLMNRRSWSPTGERLGEDPYYTESGGGQGYSSGPRGSPEAQGKASVNRGAQENGTGQATSRNGHSARQHAVADTEL
ncbi:PREDICTED: hematopoietic progenitor cell antigen CD34-like [Elephantulus edwardii]|uniref:hematopoietic progenitor cell antigen CD34-like n=1 Tax=Elephantulus edwardii TaxID=28737 RepID=UPI0003F0E411|nr:PREDICTED: hematopoietic progenitor cell antigen CD34-like [Elephantulus edwardii]